MKRRSKAGSEPVKAPRRKALKPKRDAPKAIAHSDLSNAGQEIAVARLTRELNEALEQQTATAEVLHLMSGSHGDLARVFDTILANATRLCQANFGLMHLREGDAFRTVAMHNAPPAFAKLRRREPVIRPRPLLRMAATKQLVHIADITRDEASQHRDPDVAAFIELTGVRTLLGIPMLKDDSVIGAIAFYRTEVRPFAGKQIALVTNFAAQAVIAIENARLLNELTQSLKQQTATADVLKVISRSTFDLQPVLDALVETAAKLCAADMASIATRDGEVYRVKANYALNPEWNALVRTLLFRPGRDTVTGRTLLERQTVQIADITTDPEYALSAAASVGKIRTVIGVPLLREGDPTGVMQLARSRNEPFTERQIELIRTFADQAAIAIENARLLNELRQRTIDLTGRTADLTEALEQQTAASEVLQVISSSPGDLEPVFASMLENAVRICGATVGNIYRWEGEALHIVATHNTPPAFAEARRRLPVRASQNPLIDRMVATKTAIHLTDLAARTDSVEQTDPGLVMAVELGGVRTVLVVPMLKENELIGSFSLYRQEPRPFSDKQIELVENFAAQAVIAIENARLLNELRQRTTDLTERTADLTEALEQQTATSEVLQVISRSSGDLEPVFATMLENAARICEAKFGNIYRWDGEALQLVAAHNTPPAYAEERRRSPYRPYPHSPIGRLVADKTVAHVSDIMAEEVYIAQLDPVVVSAVTLGGFRTLLGVPLLSKGELTGTFFLSRQEVRPFTDKQIELVKNFASQAVIAIENARLLNELREALEQQTATSEVLQVISSSPGELEPVFQAMLENATRICEAKFGLLLRFDGDAFHMAASVGTPPELSEFLWRRGAFQPVTGSHLDRLTRTKQVSHTADYAAEGVPSPPVTLGGARSTVDVPMLKDDELIGAFSIYRQEVRPFTDKQIELVKNFAAQAVIAIENARLLNELKLRTSDLTEALEQQTATSEVLKVISTTHTDLEPAFHLMLEKATRLCNASFGNLLLKEGQQARIVAMYNAPEAFSELRRRMPLFRPAEWTRDPTRPYMHITDCAEDPAYKQRHPGAIAMVELAKARTLLGVPMMKDGQPIGYFALYRQEVEPFTDKQIELVQNFAAQAVIAIENARLLNELRERTDQLAAQSQELAKLNQQLEQRVADQVGEIERMGRLRRFLPPQVADLIVASGTEKQLESHRREITALFCDLRGFTGFSESADPEDVMTVLRVYHEALGASIIKYSGTLERYAGDGVMVVFNDPVPVDNPALQAVLMALEMRDAIGALTETWRRWGHDIGFGIGIAHGFATLGTIGFEGRFDYAAIGTVSNVASRLCDEAKPGQILISPRVLTKVENAVTVEPVGEFALKGIRRPLAAYNVVAASPSKV